MAGRMTKEEISEYLHQVERKGKAMELREKKPTEFEKWKEEYIKIVKYLRENWTRFVISMIVRNDRYLDWKLLKTLLEKEREDMLVIVNEEISRGNVPDLNLILFMMHGKYMLMWREKHGTSGSEKG